MSTSRPPEPARVAPMRALPAEPRALLLDEPFSWLDAQLRTRERVFVSALVRKRRIPLLMPTHDAAGIADPAPRTPRQHTLNVLRPCSTASPSA